MILEIIIITLNHSDNYHYLCEFTSSDGIISALELLTN